MAPIIVSVLASFPFLQKLWDKGIDISAAVITSVIVAGIAALFWKFKLHLELKSDAAKQRQHNQLQREFDEEHATQEAELKRQRLEFERATHSGIIARVRTADALIPAWEQCAEWMRREGLLALGGNGALMVTVAEEAESMRQNAHTKRLADTLSKAIGRIALS